MSYLTQKGQLSKDFHNLLDNFLDCVYDAIIQKQIDKLDARSWHANLVALMHNEGAESAGRFMSSIVEQHPNIKWHL